MAGKNVRKTEAAPDTGDGRIEKNIITSQGYKFELGKQLQNRFAPSIVVGST